MNYFRLVQFPRLFPKKHSNKIWASIAFTSCFLGYQIGAKRHLQQKINQMHNYQGTLNQSYLIQDSIVKTNIFAKIWFYIKSISRSFLLLLIFSPLIFSTPLLLTQKYSHYWFSLMVKTLEIAGPLWIKLGQWASHRPDIFGIQASKQLEKLRDNTTPHSFKTTKRIFKQTFNQEIDEIFDEFNKKPIASGSIAQIYKAKYKGQDVIVKIRHPDVLYKMDMDIRILYSVTNFLGKLGFLSNVKMPMTFLEFRKVLVSQTDLTYENKNLQTFNKNFQNQKYVVFPKPYPEFASEQILVESFEKGVPISEFKKTQSAQTNKILADLGLRAFYKMFIYDNFIHADCHSGNMLARIVEKEQVHRDIFDKISDGIFSVVDSIVQWYCDRSLGSGMKEIKEIQKKDQNQNSYENQNFVPQLVILDVGMVTILNESDRKYLIELIYNVILKKPKECARVMLEMTDYQKNNQDNIKYVYEDIEKLFTEISQNPIYAVNVGNVLTKLVDILRGHKYYIEGHLAALLTNLIVLEGLAKDLDEEINIIGKAASFLLNLGNFAIKDVVKQIEK